MALQLRVHQTVSVPTVSVGVNVPVACPADEMACVLIVGVGLRWPALESLAALSKAGTRGAVINRNDVERVLLG